MANYTFTTYWVEGTKETIHQLHDAIANADGWTSKAFENLGLNTEGKEDEYSGWFRAEWHYPNVEDKDDYSVLKFEEDYPWERGTMMQDLFEEERFEGKLTHLYYYAEERDSGVFQTNDSEGKYFPNRLVISMPPEDEDDEWVWIYAKDETDAVRQLHEQNLIPEALNDFESIKQYVDEKFGADSFEVAKIQEVFHPFADFM